MFTYCKHVYVYINSYFQWHRRVKKLVSQIYLQTTGTDASVTDPPTPSPTSESLDAKTTPNGNADMNFNVVKLTGLLMLAWSQLIEDSDSLRNCQDIYLFIVMFKSKNMILTFVYYPIFLFPSICFSERYKLFFNVPNLIMNRVKDYMV